MVDVIAAAEDAEREERECMLWSVSVERGRNGGKELFVTRLLFRARVSGVIIWQPRWTRLSGTKGTDDGGREGRARGVRYVSPLGLGERERYPSVDCLEAGDNT